MNTPTDSARAAKFTWMSDNGTIKAYPLGLGDGTKVLTRIVRFILGSLNGGRDCTEVWRVKNKAQSLKGRTK